MAEGGGTKGQAHGRALADGPRPRPAPPRPRVKACAALASRLLLCAGVARNGAAAAVPRGAGGVPRSGRAAGPAVHPILTRCSRPRVQAAPQPAGRTSGPHLRSTRRTAHTRGSAVELWGHAYPPTNAQTARGARGGPRTGFALATTAKPDLCIRRQVACAEEPRIHRDTWLVNTWLVSLLASSV